MKSLMSILPKRSGRGVGGKIAVRHQGGRHKRFLRQVDFLRSDKKVGARVEAVEYDPNRTANIALLAYSDGEKRYILVPEGLKVGDRVEAGATTAIKVGNALPLEQIPVGTSIHNIEIRPGMGGQVVRGAGSFAVVQGKEETAVLVKLPSGEIKRFEKEAFATIGQVGRVPHVRLRKAGANRRRGIRPTVRGVAMHPAAHPHGGGEGRSPEGMPPKTPWGKPARGVKTRQRKKHSNRLIVQRRKIGYGSKS